MMVIEPCVDTVVALHKLKTSCPCLPRAKQTRLTHGSMLLNRTPEAVPIIFNPVGFHACKPGKGKPPNHGRRR